MVAPSVFCDVNGDYRGSDYEIHRAPPGFTNYTTFSLWDTYRAAMPLMTILHPERMPDIVRTMLAMADEQGRLPVWHLWGNETDCMVGNPGIPVVADAIVKGIEGFDREKAFEAIKKDGHEPRSGQRPADEVRLHPVRPVQRGGGLRHGVRALADGAAARAAEALGRTEEANYFTERSHSYRNCFDPATRFMRGRDSKRRLAHAVQPPSPRRTVPTTTARETPGSTRGSCRTTSRGSSGVSAAARRCSESSIRSSR